ncbi:MAG: serine protease [Bythopirellula sp.]|nr:serine protease [Bythopirellula sp.]
MKVPRVATICRRRARYCLAIAGTILFAHLALGSEARADFSVGNFKRVWAEEFGLGLVPDAKPQVAFQSVPQQPHPAVARIVVPEGEATSFGSGTLVDVRDGYGIVVTNWHVVRDAQGPIEVIFPNGFASKARALKVDEDWDLAALVIYQPQASPVKIADTAPQPGDQLTICGYGPGIYRSATGRCTQYYSPKEHLPQQMVELNVEARQGDSGGPIFNSRGELAGVLFGAGQGTTLGSFGGRVDAFLASLAPDIGRQTEATLASAQAISDENTTWRSSNGRQPADNQVRTASTALLEPPAFEELQQTGAEVFAPQAGQLMAQSQGLEPVPTSDHPLFEKIKSGLAALGLFSIVVMFLKAAG